jgi:DNA topoisomerase I
MAATLTGSRRVDRTIKERIAHARAARLRYVSDAEPGIRRVRNGQGFKYLDARDRSVTDEHTLHRIRSLVIPPAWTDVWITPHENGHIQAIGRDARGRKQFRYHARWREVRDQSKYEKVIAFAKALPMMRTTIQRDLRRPGLSRRKVLAGVVSLLEKTLIRIGNDEYARQNNHYGLTTIRDKHAKVNGSTIKFRFVGKSGIDRSVELDSPTLAKIVKKCQDLPGQELFAYIDDDGRQRDVKSSDVNEYLREISGEDFTAKDFRTWAGTVLAASALREFETFDSKTQAKKNLVAAIERVAERLGNTRSVCKKCYIHPAILDTYLDGSLVKILQKRAEKEIKHVSRLPPEEAAVLALLQQKLKRQ